MGKARRHQDHELLSPLCAQREEREVSGVMLFLSPCPLLMLCSLVASDLLFFHPPTSSSSLLGKPGQRCQITAWVQSKPVQGSCSPTEPARRGEKWPRLGLDPSCDPCSFSNALPYYLTISSSFSSPPPPPSCCACFFLSLLLFPSFPCGFFPASSCFLNQFQIDIEMLFFCFVDQGLGRT